MKIRVYNDLKTSLYTELRNYLKFLSLKKFISRNNPINTYIVLPELKWSIFLFKTELKWS